MRIIGRWFTSILAPTLVIFAGSLIAVAQSTATLAGTIEDSTGAVVQGATIKVHSLTTGTDRESVSDAAGAYAIPSLQPGDYQVQVSSPGFGMHTVEKVTLEVDQRATINVKLEVASAGAVVDVTSAAPVIDAQSMTVGQVIDQRTVQELPLNGRHLLDLTVLTPGGVTPPQNGNLTTPLRGLGANSFITAGNREDSINFQINGVNLNDMSQNQITFQPSINTTSEFKINNSTYSAEYGRSSGSIVNVSTRSGTNAFHGEVFDYVRNNSLDTRNYFNRKGTAQSALKRNNFGVAVGGPIWRDHTFFFFSYEALRQHQGIVFQTNVLSAAQRARATAVNNPAVVALLPLIPLSNVPGDPLGIAYTSGAPAPVNIDQYTGDVSHVLSSKDQLHGFYAFQKDARIEPNLQGNTIPGFGDLRNAHRQILTLNETHIFSPTVVNEARLGLNRISIAFVPKVTANPNDYHIADGVNAAIGIPEIRIPEIGLDFGGPTLFPQGRNDTLGIFSDTATYLTGKHTIKFGGEFRRGVNDSFTGDTGLIGFAPTTSGGVTTTGVTNFINGNATTFTITPSTVSGRFFINAAGAFVQDNYKVTPNLVLELGLRFEWNGTPTEGANRFVIFDPGTVSLIRTGTHGVGAVYKQNYNVEPRLGFALDVFGNGKTVVRSGYGFMADQPTSNVVGALNTNPPFTSSASFTTSAGQLTVPLTTVYAASKVAGGTSFGSVQRNFRNAYTESFNLNLQQELPGGIAMQVGYFGSVGRHLRVRRNLNQPVNGGARPYLAVSASSDYLAGQSLAASNINEVSSVSSSNYNALWITAKKNFARGVQFNTSYTYGKSMDINSLGSQGGNALQDSFNPGNNYGPSDFDVRHRIAANTIYDLPFKRNRLVAGFRVAGILQWQTGNPFTVTNTSTYTGVSGVVRPNLIGPAKYYKNKLSNGNVGWLVPDALPASNGVCSAAAPTPGCIFQNTTNSIGTMSRNKLYGPGFANLDFSLEKNTKITERVTFQLRGDVFDVANHPSFGQPTAGQTTAVASPTSTTFGQINSTRFAVGDVGSSRQLQIAGKFLF